MAVIKGLHGVAQFALLGGGLLFLAWPVLPQLIAGAVLVHHPHGVLGVGNPPGGKLQADGAVDGDAVGGAHVQAVDVVHQVTNIALGAEAKRQPQQLDLVAVFTQCLGHAFNVVIRPAAHKGNQSGV